MISRYDSKDGKRSLVFITNDEAISVTIDENGTALIEGSLDDLRLLYDCLADLFDEGA